MSEQGKAADLISSIFSQIQADKSEKVKTERRRGAINNNFEILIQEFGIPEYLPLFKTHRQITPPVKIETKKFGNIEVRIAERDEIIQTHASELGSNFPIVKNGFEIIADGEILFSIDRHMKTTNWLNKDATPEQENYMLTILLPNLRKKLEELPPRPEAQVFSSPPPEIEILEEYKEGVSAQRLKIRKPPSVASVGISSDQDDKRYEKIN